MSQPNQPAPLKTDLGEQLNGFAKGLAFIFVVVLLWNALPFAFIILVGGASMLGNAIALFFWPWVAVPLAGLVGWKTWRRLQAKRLVKAQRLAGETQRLAGDRELAAMIADLRAKGYGQHYSDPLREEMIEARRHR